MASKPLGNMVDVPVSNDGKIAVARVIRIAYLPAERAPFFLNKTKDVNGINCGFAFDRRYSNGH